MTRLSKIIAQKIVSEMMDVIPYNINVMDEKGVIIGSGDSSRIGHIHEGAIKSIQSENIVEIYEDNEKMKPGVNEPIIINNNLIGVIGITGNPDEVRRFSKLVRVTAVLLIEQSKIDEDIHNKRLNKQKFYYELTHRKARYDESFHQIAKSYGMDLTRKCQAILVDCNINCDKFRTVCHNYSHYSELDNKVVFFAGTEKDYENLLDKLKQIKDIRKISIGPKEHIAAVSLEKAEDALELGKKIKPSSLLYSYEELKLFINLSHSNKETFSSFITDLNKVGNKLELIQTIQAYIEENGDINNISNKMKIHRNTLNYRLERINQLTGKNPKNLLNLFELLCGLIWM